MTLSETQTLPTHVGIILDGNRRWAKENGLAPLKGHRQGMDVLRDVSFYAFERGVQYLSAFIFSTENWRRTDEEVNYLMGLTVKAVEKYLDEYHQRGIKLVALGRRKGVSQKVLDAITRAEEKTSGNTQGTLALCFNYGGKEELVDAVKQMVASGITPLEITTDVVAGALYYPGIPDVDLIIRTSGEQRTSGFMLYRSDYAELYFVKKHWPAFTIDDFNDALIEFDKRKRRYGK